MIKKNILNYNELNVHKIIWIMIEYDRIVQTVKFGRHLGYDND